MTGREIIKWIKENGAEDCEIYVEEKPKLLRPSREIVEYGSEDCPCFLIIVLK